MVAAAATVALALFAIGAARMLTLPHRSRHVATAHGGFSFFVELFNALGTNNVTRVSGYNFNVDPAGVVSGTRITESVLGVVPSFGITYEF